MISDADAQRFWSKVDVRGPDECWPWTAARAKHRGGYGFFRLAGRTVYAHRLALELELGTGATVGHSLVCHRCNTPSCCNPKHLYQGDHRTNGRDAAANGLVGRWDRRGECNPAAKLTAKAVLAIRLAISRGRTDAGIAREYGVTPTAINHIRSGRNWGWLKPPASEVGQDVH